MLPHCSDYYQSTKTDSNVNREYYRKVQKVGHHKKGDKHKTTKQKEHNEDERKNSPHLSHQSHDEMTMTSPPSELSVISATSEVELNWSREHRKGLARLMDDLHIRRRSADGKKEGA